MEVIYKIGIILFDEMFCLMYEFDVFFLRFDWVFVCRGLVVVVILYIKVVLYDDFVGVVFDELVFKFCVVCGVKFDVFIV